MGQPFTQGEARASFKTPFNVNDLDAHRAPLQKAFQSDGTMRGYCNLLFAAQRPRAGLLM